MSNFIYKIRDLAINKWGHKLLGRPVKEIQTITIKLTSIDSRRFSQSVLDMMNETFIIDGGVKIETDKVVFRTLLLPEIVYFKVIEEGAARSTMSLGKETICINSH